MRRADHLLVNELTLFAPDGSVFFGDVVILYTSNQTTIPISV
jgi:hypothetical protein